MLSLFHEFWIEVQLLGLRHNVDPLVFAVLYVASIPPYILCLGWLINAYRRKKAIALPLVLTLIFFILPASYILMFGRDVAWWVYLVIGIIVIYGLISIRQRLIKHK